MVRLQVRWAMDICTIFRGGQFTNGTHTRGCITEKAIGLYPASIPNGHYCASRGLPAERL